MTDDDLRNEHLEAATRTLAAISRMDAEAVADELHPDLVFELPYEKAVPDMDRDGFLALLNSMFRANQRFTMTLVETVPALDPNVLVLRYEGDCLSVDGSVTYRNSYLAILEFTDGRIRRWREWDNPVLSRRMNEKLAAVLTRSG